MNNSDIDWPATAVLRVATGTSGLHDASWLSATDIVSLGTAVPAHAAGEISFDITTPAVTDDTPVFEQLELSDGGQQLGTVNLALTVVPGMTEPTSSDADDKFDQQVTGGCSAGGGGGGAGAVALMILVLGRRRRG